MSEQRKYVPFVSAETNLKEFTIRALVIGLVLAVILGAANAYLGLKAGMTIAATYPAAVIGMALIKAMRGSILEENFTRTVGSIGESVAAGAIFTIPAFYIVYLDSQRQGVAAEDFFTYGTTTIILIAGGVLGIMFVALLRRVMVEDTELVFPESIAAAEIHKSGQKASRGSMYLFAAMGVGGLIKALGEFKLFSTYWEKFYTFSKQLITGTNFTGQGGMLMASPGIAPAYIGVGYIIGPKLAALNFAGTLLAWGLLTPMILYFLAPGFDIQAIASNLMAADPNLTSSAAMDKAWVDTAYKVWRFIVRPIAIGGMLVSAVYTLYRMRASLAAGLKRSVGDVRKAAKGIEVNVPRTEKDLRFNWIIIGIVAVAVITFIVAKFIFHAEFHVALVAATILIILAFFFAAVSGYLVGIMGSSNNPISGLTLTALVVTALIMVLLGVHGQEGVATTLGVAAIVCVGAAVAGEMLQDLKAGHILGGTPWRMQVGDILGVVVSAAVMFFVLRFLNEGDIAKGAVEGYEGGFGSTKLSAPQANLMALLSQGIVGGKMAWPLIIAGMLMGFAFILAQVRSPMLVCVGMYLPLETTFAIFIGGIIKGIMDFYTKKRGFSAGQLTTSDNVGILLASGLIAGEALVGLIFAIFAVGNMFPPAFSGIQATWWGIVILIIIGYILVRVPLKAGKVSE